MTFEEELRDLINRRSMERFSDTPDFILAKYLTQCLDAFNEGCRSRQRWYSDQEDKRYEAFKQDMESHAV